MDALEELKSNRPDSGCFSNESLLHRINDLSEWSDEAYFRIEEALYELSPIASTDDKVFRAAVREAVFIFSHLAQSFGWEFDDDDHFEYRNLKTDQVYNLRERVNLVFTGFISGEMPKRSSLDQSIPDRQ